MEEASSVNLNPLRFTNTGSGNATVSYKDYLSCNPDFEYKVNGQGDWTTWTKATYSYYYSTITLQPNDYIEVRGVNNKSIGHYNFSEPDEMSLFEMSGTISASGNIMSLIYGSGLTSENTFIIPSNVSFEALFCQCTSLMTSPELPATTLSNGCYTCMFESCSQLTVAPILPATIVSDSSCYYNMFTGCSSLSSVTCLATSGEHPLLGYYAPQTGTFYKNTSVAESDARAMFYIPSGWTVQDYTG